MTNVYTDNKYTPAAKTSVTKVYDGKSFTDKIKRNEVYHIWELDAKLPVMTMSGKQIVDNFKVTTWSEFLNAGAVTSGRTYDILKAVGPNKFTCIYQGAAQNFGFLNGIDEQSQQPQAVIPYKYPAQNIHSGGKGIDMFNKTLADTLNNSQSQTLGALQEVLTQTNDHILHLESNSEAQRREYEEQIKELQKELMEKERMIFEKEKVIEQLKRDMDNLEWRQKMEKELKDQNDKFKEEQADPLDKIVGLVDKLSPLAGLIGSKMPGGMPGMMQPPGMVIPQKQMQDYTQHKAPNVEYSEAQDV